jgi:mono/diheme cytochrome c family protein
MPDFRKNTLMRAWLGCALLLTAALSVAGESEGRYQIGSSATSAEVARWDISVYSTGRNLPAGSGTVQAGEKIYANQCQACHGESGKGGLGDPLVGGVGSLASAKPLRTIGSFWPYAPTIFDYVRRAMPMYAPQSLTNDEVYAVTGYLLYLNKLIEQDAVIDAQRLANIQMPNRKGFVLDAR